MRTVQKSAWCKPRRELSNEYLLAKIGVDTAENEPCKVCPLSAYRSPRCLPDINPTSYRTCQQQAAKVVPTVLRCAVQCPAQRSQLLDAVARIAAGSRPAGEKLAKAPAFREVLKDTIE